MRASGLSGPCRGNGFSKGGPGPSLEPPRRSARGLGRPLQGGVWRGLGRCPPEGSKGLLGASRPQLAMFWNSLEAFGQGFFKRVPRFSRAATMRASGLSGQRRGIYRTRYIQSWSFPRVVQDPWDFRAYLAMFWNVLEAAWAGWDLARPVRAFLGVSGPSTHSRASRSFQGPPGVSRVSPSLAGRVDCASTASCFRIDSSDFPRCRTSLAMSWNCLEDMPRLTLTRQPIRSFVFDADSARCKPTLHGRTTCWTTVREQR